MGDEATADGPARRRASWNLKTIVEEVAGRPISELQDPARPVHPYLRKKNAEPVPPTVPDPAFSDPDDPIGLLYPPLVGPTGREFHGKAHEHHRETLERHQPPVDAEGRPLRPPGPSHRPERLYLHYLLLHMDRLSDSALRYLRTAVEEEIAHRSPPPPRRARPPPLPPSPEPTEDRPEPTPSSPESVPSP